MTCKVASTSSLRGDEQNYVLAAEAEARYTKTTTISYFSKFETATPLLWVILPESRASRRGFEPEKNPSLHAVFTERGLVRDAPRKNDPRAGGGGLMTAFCETPVEVAGDCASRLADIGPLVLRAIGLVCQGPLTAAGV